MHEGDCVDVFEDYTYYELGNLYFCQTLTDLTKHNV